MDAITNIPQVIAVDQETWRVPSKSDPSAIHTVELVCDMTPEDDEYRCDCTAGTYGRKCSHIKAVQSFRGASDKVLLSNVWGYVVSAIQPNATRALIREYCRLVEFDHSHAAVHVDSEMFFQAIKDRLENIEAAFEFACARVVRVALEMSPEEVETTAILPAAVEVDEGREWEVPSESDPYVLYTVTLGSVSGRYTCNCTAGTYKQGSRECSHIKAVHALRTKELTQTVEQESAAIVPVASAVTAPAVSEVIPNTPPNFTLSPDQKAALAELLNFAHAGTPVHTLTGFAGTGKTMLLQVFVAMLRQSGDNRKIVFTAPTNQATQVLREMVSRWELNIQCVTCAKLLGLRPSINYTTGKQEFKSTGEISQMQDYDLVIVDEASMVSEDLHEIFIEESNLLTRLLFVGDWVQLPPVGEACSKVFLGDTDNISKLTEVQRYSGAIAILADDVRQNIESPSPINITTQYSPEGDGVYVLTPQSWQDNLIRAFQSEQYMSRPNYVRALAWTNKAVDAINQRVRKAIIGVDAPRFTVGERLITDEPYGITIGNGGYNILLQTSSQVEITGVMEGTSQGWKVWYLDVLTLDADGRHVTVPVLHESEARRFDQEQKKLKQGKSWKRFYEAKQSFAWLKYAYASTVHKAQGSTFDHVFVNLGDILANTTRSTIQWPDGRKQLVYERKQLFYVALTRASRRAIFF